MIVLSVAKLSRFPVLSMPARPFSFPFVATSAPVGDKRGEPSLFVSPRLARVDQKRRAGQMSPSLRLCWAAFLLSHGCCHPEGMAGSPCLIFFKVKRLFVIPSFVLVLVSSERRRLRLLFKACGRDRQIGCCSWAAPNRCSPVGSLSRMLQPPFLPSASVC